MNLNLMSFREQYKTIVIDQLTKDLLKEIRKEKIPYSLSNKLKELFEKGECTWEDFPKRAMGEIACCSQICEFISEESAKEWAEEVYNEYPLEWAEDIWNFMEKICPVLKKQGC